MRIALAFAFAAFAVPATLLTSAQSPALQHPGIFWAAPAIASARDNDRDDKKRHSNEGRKIRRHGHVAPPAWYNGSNGYFANGSWHHKRVHRTPDRDRDRR